MADLFRIPSKWPKEEEAIRAVEAAYDAAWQAADIDGLLTCLTTDAVLVNPRGEVARGHHEIRQSLGEFIKTEALGSKHTSVISRVEFITPDVVIVDGEAIIERANEDKKHTSSLTHRFTDLLVRKNDRWAIAHVRAYVLMTRPHSSPDNGMHVDTIAQ
jgi:uncharacterized protein (TIGR02246 family)